MEWNYGKPMRKFLYVDDMTEACVFLWRALLMRAYIMSVQAKKLPLKNWLASAYIIAPWL